MTLMGFIGDIPGNENNLVGMDAVVVGEHGAHFRLPAAGGPARPVSVDELRFVHPAPQLLVARYQPGQMVWFAGRNLIARSSSNSVMLGFSSSWVSTPQGYRLRTGASDELRRWRDDRAHRLSQLVHTYLYDPVEKSVGAAASVLDLYLAVENTACKRRSLTAALFHFEMHDAELFQFERKRAARNGAFADESAFDAEFTRLRQWLREPRLTMEQRPSSAHASLSRDWEVAFWEYKQMSASFRVKQAQLFEADERNSGYVRS